MLSSYVNERLIQLRIDAKSKEDAIRKAASVLLAEDKIKETYIDDMVRVAKESSYIVITKHVALPHARAETGALKNAIAIATLKHPIVFGHPQNDPVRYLFCLCATDNEGHLNAIAELVGLLEDTQFYELLDQAQEPAEVMAYIRKKEQQR